MKALVVAANVSALLGLGALSLYWPPAAFAFVLVGPLSLYGVRSLSDGGVSARAIFVTSACAATAGIAALTWVWPPALFAAVLAGPIVALGFFDMIQTKKAVLRNFPVVGHMRYLLEAIRPELHQYFIESNSDGSPFKGESPTSKSRRRVHSFSERLLKVQPASLHGTDRNYRNTRIQNCGQK